MVVVVAVVDKRVVSDSVLDLVLGTAVVVLSLELWPRSSPFSTMKWIWNQRLFLPPYKLYAQPTSAWPLVSPRLFSMKWPSWQNIPSHLPACSASILVCTNKSDPAVRRMKRKISLTAEEMY